MRSIFSLILFSILAISASAAPSNAEMANSLYEAGDYRKAAEAYQSIVDAEGASPALYYNLANSYAQTGDLGNAILYYSRAYRLDPSNKDIKNNLEYFASKVEDSNRAELRGKKISVAPDHETFFKAAHRVIAEEVKSDTWAFLAAACFILFLAGVAVYLFCSNVLLRKTGFFGGIALFFISIMFVIFASMSAAFFGSHDQAVLMAYKTPLLIEPSSDSKAATNQLCQGSRFEIIAEETNVEGIPTWYKVRLNADIEGWLRASDIAII
ncbi:MAG: tetratricopeptide repeat protein, partial [Muribaculaceae bacterium]|nr:tetratricopeptide repeat protein [Muribaculaceae bacterium]